MRQAPLRRTGAIPLGLVLAGCGTLFSPPSLDERLPDSIGGRPFEVEVVTTPETMSGPTVAPDLLEQLGVDIGEVVVAVGPPIEIGGDNDLSVTAVQYPGVAEDRLAAAYLDLLSAMQAPVPATRAGRSGWQFAGLFVLIRHDAVYHVSGADERVDEFVAAIP